MPTTNETVEAACETAAATESIAEQFAGQLHYQIAQGTGYWHDITTWLAARGVGFSIDLAVALVMLLVGWLLIPRIGALTGKAISKALSKSGRENALFSSFVSSVTEKACWALLAVMVLSRLGVNVGPLIAGLGVTGFILGFAFQESLGNLASGMMIAVNQPFKVGDFVDAAGYSGSIVEVNMMATILSTPDNKKVVIPNKSVWGGPIVNYTALGRRRVDMKIGIAYGEDVAAAMEVVKKAVDGVPGVLKDVPVAVNVAGLDDSQVSINIRPWAKCADYWSVYSETLQAVKSALAKAGIEIPFPQITVHQAKA